MKEILAQIIYPNPILIVGFLMMILFDLVSGVRKAKKKGEATNSKGLRKTIDKTSSYSIFILSVTTIINITMLADTDKRFTGIFNYSVNGLLLGACWIELKSVLENLIILNAEGKKPNDLAKYLLIPLHNALIFKFSKAYRYDNQE